MIDRNAQQRAYYARTREQQLAYKRDHYQQTKHLRDKKASARNTQAHRVRIRAWLAEKKEERGCRRCGITDPRVLDFHHLDPATKAFSIGTAKGHSREALEAEIAKCEVLCSNCHRIEHAEERSRS